MAPKLPPPAKTKAVFAGPAWLDRDKAPGAPRSRGERPRDVRRRYSTRKRGDAINIGCDNRHSGMVRRTRPRISRFRVRVFDAPRNDGLRGTASAFDERLLDHKMAGLAV